MIDLNEYRLNNSSIVINDLVALANIEKTSIDSRVLSFNDNQITIEGLYKENYKNKYAVCGTEIIKIISHTNDNKNTTFNIEREQYGTKKGIEINSHFRTVIIIDYNEDIVLQSWNFEDTLGNVQNSLFPVELGSGSIQMKSDLKLWSPHSLSQKYRVKPRKSIAYIFKGIGSFRFLKFTTVVSKIRFNTRGKTEPNKIILEIKTLLSKWYDKDISINSQLKGTTPKDFFKMLFNLKDDEIYYADGVTDDSFLKLNNLHTKEYSKVSEILKAYCSNGVRFIFDAKEKLKVFSDFKVDSIQTQKTINYDLTNLMLSENEQMIYNTISTQVFQRQTLYNFKDLDNKYVKFFKKLSNIVESKNLIGLSPSGDYLINIIEVQDEDLHKSVQLKDYVIFKRTKEPFIELPAMVISIGNENKVALSPIIKDKDYKLFNYGKNKYLYDLLVGQNTFLDLYYVRDSLPIVFKYTRNKKGEEIDSSLDYPILPRVNGETKYTLENNITFGCASNLKVGQYTGIIEEIDKIYGTWDSSKLLYNREIEQFSNTKYPPIFVLSNKMNERLINGATPIKNYTSFDNSDLLIEIKKPNDTKSDARLIITNTQTVNSDTDLYIDTEINRFGNQILEINELQNYKIGDVLIANKPDDLSPQEELEFDEVISTIKWVVIGKESQRQEDGTFKNYIFLDSPFAKRQSQDKKYSFTKFPNWSIIYLQELYFRGNPVIEFSQDVVGYSKTTNYDGDTSVELFGEKKYELDSKQLDKINLRLLMGYILHNFQATDVRTTKYNLPISVFNGIDIDVLDVISVIDPIYTNISQDLKWLVLSVNLKSNTNEVELKLLNLNSKNTEPYKLDVKDVLEYKPVEIPQYSHTGGEGNTEDNNDGTGGNDVDKTLGQFWLAEVDTKKFRARVEKFEGNYIYFKDFNGEEVEQYKNKLFPVDEFAVTIKGETIFVQSDMNYRAFIKKRRVYDTEEVIILPEDDISFLVTTTYVDIDGTFYGRKMMMGDRDNYLSVDPIKGVKVVGDFVVGENNKNPNNDLWNALSNNRVFRQDTKPYSTLAYKLKENDVWYDTANGNKVYVYKNDEWVSTQDQDIITALGRAKIFYQAEPPKDEMRKNDLWYDTDDGNHPYIYDGTTWVDAQDKIFETEGKNKVYFQESQPPTFGEGVKEGDVWFDTKNNNTMYVLFRKQDSQLEWRLANDSTDRIDKGKVVINANTIFNGDATIVSQGNDETTIIKGGSITFTRGGQPITIIRNMRIGEIETDSNGSGVLSFPNFKNMNLLLSIKSFNISQNIRSLGCYANLINLAENKYQVFLYGKESGLAEGISYETNYNNWTNSYYIDCLSLTCTSIKINAPEIKLSGWRKIIYSGDLTDISVTSVPSINIKVYVSTPMEIKLVKNITVSFKYKLIRQWETSYQSSNGNTRYALHKEFSTYLNEAIPISVTETSFNINRKGLKVEVSLNNDIFSMDGFGGYPQDAGGDFSKTTYNSSVSCGIIGVYNLDKLENLVGHGSLFYIAMEE